MKFSENHLYRLLFGGYDVYSTIIAREKMGWAETYLNFTSDPAVS